MPLKRKGGLETEWARSTSLYLRISWLQGWDQAHVLAMLSKCVPLNCIPSLSSLSQAYHKARSRRRPTPSGGREEAQMPLPDAIGNVPERTGSESQTNSSQELFI